MKCPTKRTALRKEPHEHPEKIQYIKNIMMKVCEREKLSVEEVFYIVIFGCR